jgi:hypothetical protein
MGGVAGWAGHVRRVGARQCGVQGRVRARGAHLVRAFCRCRLGFEFSKICPSNVALNFNKPFELTLSLRRLVQPPARCWTGSGWRARRRCRSGWRCCWRCAARTRCPAPTCAASSCCCAASAPRPTLPVRREREREREREVCGAHSLSGADLRRVFMLLRGLSSTLPVRSETRIQRWKSCESWEPESWWPPCSCSRCDTRVFLGGGAEGTQPYGGMRAAMLLLRAMKQMTRREDPLNFFEFNGIDTGIQVRGWASSLNKRYFPELRGSPHLLSVSQPQPLTLASHGGRCCR